MRKISFQLLFWLVYLIQNVLLIFLVNGTRQPPPGFDSFWFALANCLVLLIPKLLFTYFVLQVVLPQVITGPFQKRGIIYALVGLILSLLLYRSLVVYFVEPVIYLWHSGQPLLYPLGLLVALMDIGFVAGVAVTIKQVQLQFQANEREKSLANEKLESEIRFLRNQTNPHFLFNTLNNIYALARRKSEQTPAAILKLSKLLRFMLYETAKPLIPIEEEIRVLDDFIELQKIRFSSRLTINFYREIDNDNEPISPLLLLPFVENAFKHGPGESHLESYIHIEMILRDGILDFQVENTQEGTAALSPQQGIGLRNVKRQLELIYRDHAMEVKNEKGLFKVALRINLKKDEKNQLSYIGG